MTVREWLFGYGERVEGRSLSHTTTDTYEET